MARSATRTPTRPEDPVAVTDEVLRRFVGYHLKRGTSVLQADMNAALRPFDLRMVSFSVLAMVVGNPGLRQSQLADALAVERPNLVVILDHLEDRGLITRDRISADRRAYALNPTPKGRRLCDRATAAVAAHEARMFEAITETDRRAIITAMQSIQRNGGGAA